MLAIDRLEQDILAIAMKAVTGDVRVEGVWIENNIVVGELRRASKSNLWAGADFRIGVDEALKMEPGRLHDAITARVDADVAALANVRFPHGED